MGGDPACRRAEAAASLGAEEAEGGGQIAVDLGAEEALDRGPRRRRAGSSSRTVVVRGSGWRDGDGVDRLAGLVVVPGEGQGEPDAQSQAADDGDDDGGDAAPPRWWAG